MVMLLDEQEQTGLTDKIKGFFSKKLQNELSNSPAPGAPGQQMSQIPFLKKTTGEDKSNLNQVADVRVSDNSESSPYSPSPTPSPQLL